MYHYLSDVELPNKLFTVLSAYRNWCFWDRMFQEIDFLVVGGGGVEIRDLQYKTKQNDYMLFHYGHSTSLKGPGRSKTWESRICFFYAWDLS